MDNTAQIGLPGHIKHNGPRNIQIFKHSGKRGNFDDSWTVVFTRASTWGGKHYIRRQAYLGMTDSGSYYHGETDLTKGNPAYGSRMKWDDLSVAQKKTVLDEYEDLWQVKFVRTPLQNVESCAKQEEKD